MLSRPTFTTGFAHNAGSAAFPSLWNGLVGAWCPTMGKQGTKLYDFSGHGHHGTLNNFALTGGTSNYIGGKFGNCLNFDGVNDNVDCGTINEIDTAANNLSLAFWMRSTATATQTLLTYDNNSVLQPATDWYLYCAGGGNLRIGGFGSTGELDSGISSSSLRNGIFHLVVVVLKETTLEVWVDGILRYNPANGKSHGNFSSSFNLQFGAAENVDWYAGDIEDVFLYNKAIGAEDISLLYRGITPLTPSNILGITGSASSNDTFIATTLDANSNIETPTFVIDATVNASILDILSAIISPEVGEILVVNVSPLDITSDIQTITFQIDTTVTPSVLDILLSVLDPLVPENATFIASVLDILSSAQSPIINIAVTYSAYAQKIVSYNPLIFVTNTSPARLVKVDVTIPASPTWAAYILTGLDNAKDVFVNEVSGYVYVVGANGKVLKAPLVDLNTQTIIDLSDPDDLQTIMALPNLGLTYVSTDNALGELYLIDERNAFEIDTDFQAIAPQVFAIDTDFNIVTLFGIDTEIYALGKEAYQINTDFKCLDYVIGYTSVDSLTPINFGDVHVYIDNVELAGNDLIINSIQVVHSIDEESQTTFSLTRRHDQLNTTLDGATVIITNQNAVRVVIKGHIEFEGFISELNTVYDKNADIVNVVALMPQPTTQYNTVALSLPGLTQRLSLYDVLVENPRISNPVIDPTNETNPKKYKGIRVSLGKKIVENVLRILVFDNNNAIASAIQKGKFSPLQNWTYFWSPTVRRFGDFVLGQTTSVYFDYIGTSMAPVSSDLWSLENAKHRRQRINPSKETLLGDGTVYISDFNEILPIQSTAIFNALSSAGYINGGGVIQNKFKSILDYKNLNINFSSKILQFVYEIVVSKLGYTVGQAPFKTVATGANGQLISQIKWQDQPDGLYSVQPESYNYIDFCKTIAELEYQKLININGNVLPDTNTSLTLTPDAYYYYSLKLLTRLNIDNTTTTNIYNNLNGFPVSIKSITIDVATMKVILQATNQKSKQELEVIDGQFPDETDAIYYQLEKSTLLAQKSDMKTRLKVT